MVRFKIATWGNIVVMVKRNQRWVSVGNGRCFADSSIHPDLLPLHYFLLCSWQARVMIAVIDRETTDAVVTLLFLGKPESGVRAAAPFSQAELTRPNRTPLNSFRLFRFIQKLIYFKAKFKSELVQQPWRLFSFLLYFGAFHNWPRFHLQYYYSRPDEYEVKEKFEWGPFTVDKHTSISTVCGSFVWLVKVNWKGEKVSWGIALTVA